MFQCPSSGFSDFYCLKMAGVAARAVFQCPSSGFSDFYLVKGATDAAARRCFNALIRASLISTFRHPDTDLCKRKGFQCPSSGFSDFYYPDKPYGRSPVMFQCPSSGFSDFYDEVAPKIYKNNLEVSMP